MDTSTFEGADPFIDELAELTDDMLTSTELAGIRGTLTQLGKTLSERYSINLSVIVEVYDRDKERNLPLLNTGLSTSEGGEPYRTFGDSSPERYIVDGETQIVPHDRCPKYWNAWGLKWEHHSCPHCDAVLGMNCKILLDTDRCPNCDGSAVSMSKPVCDKCGFQIDPTLVVWG